ncbi:MAG: diguanylate cyclase [Gammaproteobacteria bacterium]|nr:diguanylate cyclase [Gammaproteobacteria bacterium]
MSTTDIHSSLCLNLLENSPSFIVMINEQKRICWLNQSFCDFLGLERDLLIGLGGDDVKEPCLKQVLNVSNRVEIFSGILNKWIELQDVISFNGQQFNLEDQDLTVCYYTDASKKVLAEKQLIQLESTLSHKVSHDAVTGMLNHHSMLQTLSSEVSRSRRYNNPLSLVLMNVGYDSENRSAEGQEQVRLMISQLLKDQMRWADIVGHLNGFEFVLLLPETTYESAEVLIGKLNAAIQNIAIEPGFVTYGISQWQKGDDVRMFLDKAITELTAEV